MLNNLLPDLTGHKYLIEEGYKLLWRLRSKVQEAPAEDAEEVVMQALRDLNSERQKSEEEFRCWQDKLFPTTLFLLESEGPGKLYCAARIYFHQRLDLSAFSSPLRQTTTKNI